MTILNKSGPQPHVHLFLCTDEPKRVREGSFSCVIFHKNQLYAAEYSKNEVLVFDCNHAALVQARNIKLRFTDKGFLLKLCANNNRLMCSSVRHNELHVYSLISGEFLHAYVRPGNIQQICDVDTRGSVLIADRDNNRLQVISEQEEFHILELQPEVREPNSAVLFKGYLYVTSNDTNAVYKYSC